MVLLNRNPNQDLDRLLHAAKQGRLPYEREAWLNLAFFLNQQYVEWNPSVGSIREIARREGEQNAPRPVINKIMHFVRQVHDDVLQDEPAPDVLPATTDYSDISDAMVARAWCESEAGETKTDYLAQLSRSSLWAILAGTGWLKWCWKEGEGLCILPPSFFEIFIDPYAKQFKDVRHVIHQQFMDKEQVYELYGVDVPNDSVEQADQQKTQLLRGMGAAPVLHGVTVNELWQKPSRRHPEGVYAVWTGKTQLVPPGKLPYPHLIQHRMLPFTQLGAVERPDSAYYLSPIQYLRPAQMELNKYHAQRLLIRERFANPKWWIDAALDLENDPDDSPSQILRGTSSIPGLRPEIIQPATYPPSDDGEMLEQGMMNIVGQHEVSQGQVPGRVEAAKAIDMLKEADSGAQATLRKTMASSNSQGWFQALELARTFQREDDMVMAYSREGVPEVKHFRAGKMKPGYRVKTSMTTGLARTRAARQTLALQLWDSKVITDPDQLLELMEVPTGNMLQYRINDIRLARNENLDMAQGIAVVANSWDDHAIHLREHNAYRKTYDFHALDPQSKQKFEFHCQAHKDLQKKDIVEQAQIQAILQGQPPQAAPQSDTSTPDQGTVPS